MVCKKCGREIPENTDVCAYCGSAVPADAGNEPVDVLEAAFAMADAERLGTRDEPEDMTDPVPDTDTSGAVRETQETSPPVRKKKSGVLLLGAVVLMVLALVVAAVKITPSGGGVDGVAYWTTDYDLMYRKDLKPNTQSAMLSDVSAVHVTFTKDGSGLYYMHGGTLFHADFTGSGGTNAAPAEVDSGVTDFTVLANGGAVYRKGPGDTQLCFYDGWETYLLTSNANNGYMVDSTETYVCYTSLLDGSYAYYRVPLAGNGGEEKILDDFDMIYYLDDEIIVYSQLGSETDGIYCKTIGGSTTLLAEDAQNVYSIICEDGKIMMLYMTGEGGRYDVCKYEDGVSSVLAADVSAMAYTSLADNVYIYVRTDDGFNYEWFQNVGGVESKLDLGGLEPYIYGGIRILNGREVIAEVYENGHSVLKAYTLGETGMTDPVVIAERCISIHVGTYEGRDVLYYYTNIYGSRENAYSGDLMRYCDGENVVVAEDVSSVTVLEDGTEFQVSYGADGSGTLSTVKDGVVSEIAGDVQADGVAYLGAERVMFISGSDLCLWDGKDCKQLAGDVQTFWIPEEANAAGSTYLCTLSWIF